MATFEQLPGHNLQIPNLYPVLSVPPPPVFDTQAMTEHAFNFINKVIDDLSPLNREERRARLAQLRAQTSILDEQAKDPYAYAEKMAAARDPNRSLKATKYRIDLQNSYFTGKLQEAKLRKMEEEQRGLLQFQKAIMSAFNPKDDEEQEPPLVTAPR